MVANSW